MPRTKQPPARKPVKARGALPSPRVAPQRDNTPWHGKTGVRIVIALVALAVLAFIVKSVMDARERAEARRQEARSVEQFERRVLDLNTKISSVYEGLGQVPGAFLAGAIPVEEYRKQAESWVAKFRELNQGIRTIDPAGSEELQVAKAHYVQGTIIYLDAAKVFLSAAAITDPAEREKATVLARNLFLHGTSVYGMGDRTITELKNEYEINDPPSPPPAATLPEEEIPLQAPPGAPGAPVDPAVPAEPGAPAAPQAPPVAPVAP